jgi:hypothetical protein
MDKSKATFYDENRRLYVTYELGHKFLGEKVANDIVEAFGALTGHYNSRSRDQAWRSVRHFAAYLNFIGFSSGRTEIDIVEGFGLFLKNSRRLKKTNGTHYIFIKRMVSWLSEEAEAPIWKNHGLVHVGFTREAVNVRDNAISPERLKQIVQACKRAIIISKRSFEVRANLETGKQNNIAALSTRDISNLQQLIAYEARDVWTQKELVQHGSATLAGAGMRRLAAYKELTQEACLPMFLLIMIQAAANPFALMEIKKDCMVVNPLDENSITLEWSKGRAAKVQRLSLLRQGNFSVATLVELVIRMTQPIRHLASEADSDLLFITRTGNKSKRLSSQGLHNYLADFREQNDLGHFTFADVRKAVAAAVYLNSGSVKNVSALLQHKDPRTTEIYLQSDIVKQQRFENVRKFQGLMIEIVEAADEITGSAYETTLGFGCAAPLEGHIAKSRRGEPCLEFLACATCKNAVVAVDNVQAVSRIVRAKDHLVKMEQLSHLNSDARSRYVEVFYPILNIIQIEILGAVSKQVLKKAEVLASSLPGLPVIY